MKPVLSPSVVVVGSCFWLISFVFILFVIFGYFWYKRTKQNIFYFIIFQLGVVDLFFELSALPMMLDWLKGQVPEDDWICEATGVLRTFANLCSYLMNALFAWAIYACVQMSSSRDVLKAKYTKMILCIYLIASVFSTLPLLTDSIGMGALYCGMEINDQTNWNIFWGIIVYYIPFLFSIGSIIFFISKSISQLRSYFPTANRKSCKFYKLLIIPAIFLFVNSGSIIDRGCVLLFGKAPATIRVTHFLIRQVQGCLHGGLYALMIFTEGGSKRPTSSPSDSSVSNNIYTSFSSDTSRSALHL